MTASWDSANTPWLELLLDAASPAPWDYDDGRLLSLHPANYSELATNWSWEGDAVFAAAAREAIPALLASLAASDRFRRALEDIVALDPQAFADAGDLGVAAQHIADRALA